MALAIATLASSCAREDALTADPAEMAGSGTTSSEPNPTTLTTTNDPKPDDTTGDASVGSDSDVDGSSTSRGAEESTGSDQTTDSGADASTSGDTGDGSTIGVLPFTESFDGADGAPWPVPWMAVGSAVLSATIEEGRGRLTGATGQVARMVLPGFEEADVDVTVTVTFDDWSQQGFGLYVRQNGGVLHETEPPGQGYCAYVEGGYMQSIGIWRELDGVEEILHVTQVPDGMLQPGVPYQLRLHCQQEGDQTRLRTRIWPLGAEEPETWDVDMLDDTPVLQGTAGSFAVDVYNYAGVGGVTIDDLHIAEAPPP